MERKLDRDPIDLAGSIASFCLVDRDLSQSRKWSMKLLLFPSLMQFKFKFNGQYFHSKKISTWSDPKFGQESAVLQTKNNITP